MLPLHTSSAQSRGDESELTELILDVTEWQEEITRRTASAKQWRHVRTLEWSDGTREEREVGAYTQFASGLHYRDGAGDLQDSTVQPEVLARGGVAYRTLPVKYEFSANALSDSVLTVDRDGVIGRSAVAGLTYYNSSRGESVVIASIKDAPVALIEGGLVYEDAFEGVDGDIL